MKRITRAGLLLVAGLAAACVVVPPKQMGGPTADAPAESAVVKMMAGALLPALYRGDLPCADCAGTRYALDLRPDHVFFLRTTYLGKGPGDGESVDDLGRWSLSADARTLTLSGAREPRRFSIDNSETLRLLDQAGQRIESPLNYELKRVPSYAALELKANLRGMYRYMADAAVFHECQTQLLLPVAQTADSLALERAYLKVPHEPGAPVLASVQGRIASMPKMEGEGRQDTLVVERFDQISPGETCQGP